MRLQGRDIHGLPVQDVCQHGLARSFQITSLFRALTIYENIRQSLQARHPGRFNIWREPFEGLWPAIVLEVFKVFDAPRKEILIVIVKHNLDLVQALADRVFALERGAVIHQGPAKPLLVIWNTAQRYCGLTTPISQSNPAGQGRSAKSAQPSATLALTHSLAVF